MIITSGVVGGFPPLSISLFSSFHINSRSISDTRLAFSFSFQVYLLGTYLARSSVSVQGRRLKGTYTNTLSPTHIFRGIPKGLE